MEADGRLRAFGGCARFGMDDGFMVEPPEFVFKVLADFAVGLKTECGCDMNMSKCKMFSWDDGACARARHEGHIREELSQLQEGMYVNWAGDILKGIRVFNVPIRTERYVQAKLREKAQHVKQTTETYVHDMGDEYPQELWTMLQFSLQHRATYWLRICTQEETEEMAKTVRLCIMEAVQAATGVNFETKKMAKERLRLPARMKGGGVKRATDKRYPAFLGAMLDVLPRMIDRENENGEVTVGVYSSHMTHIIGEGAYNAEGHRNTRFSEATGIGPFPREMQQAWTRMRQEAIKNNIIVEGDDQDEWNRLGPMVEPTLATVRNRGAAERKTRRRVEASTTSPKNRR
jgi:hypothetical protein